MRKLRGWHAPSYRRHRRGSSLSLPQNLCIFSVFLTWNLNFSLFAPFSVPPSQPALLIADPLPVTSFIFHAFCHIVCWWDAKAREKIQNSVLISSEFSRCTYLFYLLVWDNAPLAKFRQCINLVECWGTCVSCQNDPITLCWKSFKIYWERKESKRYDFLI